MQMSKNVNNDVRKDPPIARALEVFVKSLLQVKLTVSLSESRQMRAIGHQ